MTFKIIDGKQVSESVKAVLKEKVAAFQKERGFVPGLATVLVGENPASQVYIKNKNKSCVDVGMKSVHHHLSDTTTEKELLDLIATLNADKSIHGILVQLPLPAQINSDKVLEAINPDKDVDGFHAVNMGRLMLGQPGLKPCTPYGVMKLLESIQYNLSGAHAVVVGRSNIVGKPMAQLLLAQNATVTICHSRTKNLAEVVGQADVVVAAVGKANFVPGSWIKPGAVVIDVGINRLDSGKLTGDVDFESAKEKASWITPVPGGVGPMTIAMLLQNTLEAAQRLCER